MCNQNEMKLPSHLVRITTDEDFTQQLKLPTGFIKLFDGVVPTDRIIFIKSSCPSGRCWWVKMVQNEQDDDLFLQDGWLYFVEDNSLEYGDSILFEKIENSQLVFTIFGPTGNQKGLPNNSTTMNVQQQEPVRNEPLIGSSDSNHDKDDSEEMSLDAESANDNGPDDNDMANIDEVQSPVIKPLITELSEAFLSEHPFFTISISKSYLGQLNIPVEFAKNYLPESAKTCTLLHGSCEDVGTFEIGIRYYPYGCMRKWAFTRGWIPFVRAIGLLEGDACAFELIEKDEMKMKVSIFRDIGGRPGKVIEI